MTEMPQMILALLEHSLRASATGEGGDHQVDKLLIGGLPSFFQKRPSVSICES
jgi:hypothetical protein